MKDDLTPNSLDWLSVIALGLVWGASFMAVKIAMGGFGPLTVAAGRLALAGLILLIVTVLTRRSWPRGARLWGFVLAFAIFSNALPFVLLNWAQQTVTSAFAGVTMASVPLFVLPLAVVFVPGERFSVLKLAGMILGFVGVVLLLGPREILDGSAGWAPRAACVAAALSYAVGGIFARLAPPVDQIAYSGTALTLAAIFIVPLALGIEGLPSETGQGPVLALLFLAVFPTATATLLLVRTLRSAGPTFVTLVNFMVPVWAVAFGVALLGEVLPEGFAIATLLVLAGLAVSQFKVLASIVAKLRPSLT